jgi:hypothetical protein
VESLAAVGPAIEGALMIKKWLDDKRFQETRAVIVAALKEQQNDLIETLKASDFINAYFPQLGQMQGFFEQIRQAAEQARRYAEAVQGWAKDGRELCERFGIQAPELPDESNIIDI